jgi:hypothetical protein
MVSCNYEIFVQLIRRLIADVQVDEKWYLESYLDIADATRQGVVASAKVHFVQDGYFEGRQPFAIAVDDPRLHDDQSPALLPDLIFGRCRPLVDFHSGAPRRDLACPRYAQKPPGTA